MPISNGYAVAECTLCSELKTEPHGEIWQLLPPCGHDFHITCLIALVKGRGHVHNCPVCRKRISYADIVAISAFQFPVNPPVPVLAPVPAEAAARPRSSTTRSPEAPPAPARLPLRLRSSTTRSPQAPPLVNHHPKDHEDQEYITEVQPRDRDIGVQPRRPVLADPPGSFGKSFINFGGQKLPRGSGYSQDTASADSPRSFGSQLMSSLKKMGGEKLRRSSKASKVAVADSSHSSTEPGSDEYMDWVEPSDSVDPRFGGSLLVDSATGDRRPTVAGGLNTSSRDCQEPALKCDACCGAGHDSNTCIVFPPSSASNTCCGEAGNFTLDCQYTGCQPPPRTPSMSKSSISKTSPASKKSYQQDGVSKYGVTDQLAQFLEKKPRNFWESLIQDAVVEASAELAIRARQALRDSQALLDKQALQRAEDLYHALVCTPPKAGVAPSLSQLINDFETVIDNENGELEVNGSFYKWHTPGSHIASQPAGLSSSTSEIPNLSPTSLKSCLKGGTSGMNSSGGRGESKTASRDSVRSEPRQYPSFAGHPGSQEFVKRTPSSTYSPLRTPPSTFVSTFNKDLPRSAASSPKKLSYAASRRSPPSRAARSFNNGLSSSASSPNRRPPGFGPIHDSGPSLPIFWPNRGTPRSVSPQSPSTFFRNRYPSHSGPANEGPSLSAIDEEDDEDADFKTGCDEVSSPRRK